MKFAPGEREYRSRPVPIYREHSLVFANGLLVSFLHPQHLTLGEMGNGAARRSDDGLARQLVRAFQVAIGRVSWKVEQAVREHDRQPALRADGVAIERQRALEKADGLSEVCCR